jgi:ketosteroid isomerase-like protein
MGYQVPRSLVGAFYEIYAARDVQAMAQYFHDDVEWTINGPVDYLSFCGTHRGKAAVADMIQCQIPKVLRTYSFVPEAIVVDGDQAAMLSRQSSRRTTDGQPISYRVSNFMRFLDGKLMENLSLIDTFDAVEQVLGHPLAVQEAPALDPDGVVAI